MSYHKNQTISFYFWVIVAVLALGGFYGVLVGYALGVRL